MQFCVQIVAKNCNLYLESTEDGVLCICNLANISQNMESMWTRIGKGDSNSFSRECVLVLQINSGSLGFKDDCDVHPELPHISTGLGSSTCDHSSLACFVTKPLNFGNTLD